MIPLDSGGEALGQLDHQSERRLVRCLHSHLAIVRLERCVLAVLADRSCVEVSGEARLDEVGTARERLDGCLSFEVVLAPEVCLHLVSQADRSRPASLSSRYTS
jgi:hypothetical protein